MISFRNIETAYNQTQKCDLFHSTSEKAAELLKTIHVQMTDMILSLKVANDIVSNIHEMTPIEGSSFTLNLVSPINPTLFKVIETVLKANFGSLSLHQEDPSRIRVEWNEPASPLSEKDVLMKKNGDLFYAVLKNEPEAIERLLTEGADPNAIGPFGRTPAYAVTNDSKLLVLLGSKGALRYVKDRFGYDPMDAAFAFEKAGALRLNMMMHLR